MENQETQSSRSPEYQSKWGQTTRCTLVLKVKLQAKSVLSAVRESFEESLRTPYLPVQKAEQIRVPFRGLRESSKA